MNVFATRYWNGKGEDASSIIDWVAYFSPMGKCLVAVNPLDRSEAVAKLQNSGLDVMAFVVNPWGKWSMPLNALIWAASGLGARTITFSSVEMRVSQTDVCQLVELASAEDVLVAGAALPDHDYHPGEVVTLDGVTTPYNTFAVWNLEGLTEVGFPPIVDGTPGATQRDDGVEEPDVIARAQKLGLRRHKAILKMLGSTEWDTTFGGDIDRIASHQEKMRLKKVRPALRAARNGLGGVVIHI